MKRHSYESIVAKALSFMRANLANPISVREIAEAVFYSSVHLRTIFRTVTGQGVQPNLLRLRIEKAKELLSKTELTISEIASDVGFNESSYFASTFRRATGNTASAFRRTVRKTREMPVPARPSGLRDRGTQWFRDSFVGSSLGQWWKPSGNEWRQQDGLLLCEGESEFTLLLARPLPENFRACFDVKFEARENLPPSDLRVSLLDEDMAKPYCVFIAGAHDNSTGEVRHSGLSQQWNRRALIKEGQYQSVCLELRNDTLRFALDGERVFVHRDPFPPSYGAKCIFALGTWRSAACFRNLVVYDLGFLSLVPRTRQGDSLFNAGLFEEARRIYERQLLAGASALESMELRYKIGVCFLRQQAFSQAQGWLEKVVGLPESGFWLRQARLALLEICQSANDVPALLKGASDMLVRPNERDGVRAIINRACGGFNAAGFYERSAELLAFLLEGEDKTSVPGLLTKFRLADPLERLNRFEEAARLLVEVVESPSVPRGLRIQAMHSLTSIRASQGRIAESDGVIGRIRVETSNASTLARCDIDECANLRAQSRFEGALKILKSIPSSYPQVAGTSDRCGIQAALILCGCGNSEEARRILERIARRSPQSREMVERDFLFIPFLAREDYARASEICLKYHPYEGLRLAEQARRMIRAGVVLGIAQRVDNARGVWSECVRRFPPARCCYYGSLAQSLLSGNRDLLESMPYPARERSEMFYLAGLLCESEGSQGRARELFALSVKEDPTNRWPAVLAKQWFRHEGGRGAA